MPREADGYWPPNVTAHIITPEEKQARLAQAPPGGQVTAAMVGDRSTGTPTTTITRHVVTAGAQNMPQQQSQPSKTLQQQPTSAQQSIPSQPAQTPAQTPAQPPVKQKSAAFYGQQAITLARELSVDVLWRAADKIPIPIEEAESLLVTHGPQSVLFDFALLQELPEEEEDELDENDAYMAELPQPPAAATHPIYPDAAKSPGTARVPQPTTAVSPPVEVPERDPATETRERLAWGGVLSTSGQTVYFRPNVIRIEVEGPVRVQKGQQGNVRMMRISRATPQGTAQLATAIQTPVKPPLARSANPPVTYRQTQGAVEPDKVRVPRPQVPLPPASPTKQTEQSQTESFDEFDF